MAKGGRYLKKTAGKGRGWKIALIVLAVVALLVGSVAFLGYRQLRSWLSLIQRVEYEDRGASVEDVLDAATFNPDALTTPEE